MIENIANLKQPKTNKTEQNYERLSLVKMKHEEQFNNFFDLGIRAGNLICNKTHLYIFLQKNWQFCCCSLLLLLLFVVVKWHFSTFFCKNCHFCVVAAIVVVALSCCCKMVFSAKQNISTRMQIQFYTHFFSCKKVSVNINLK